jgi:hypothetical protein
MESTTTISEMNAIRDPYEQCVAYIKLKKIEGVDCKAKMGWIQNTRGTGTLSETGSTHPKPPAPPKPPVGSELTLTTINNIKDPYEQCLAYVKFKKIEGIDCKTKIEAIKNAKGTITGTGDMLPKIPRLPVGTGGTIGTQECRAPGSCGQGLPPIATQMGQDMQYIGAAIMKLNDTDRAELVKLVRAYLNTKWVKIQTQEVTNDRKDEIKNIRNEMKDTVQEIKVKNRDEIRAQQEIFRAKIQEMKKNSVTI